MRLFRTVIALALLGLLFAGALEAQPTPAGHWDFEDAADLGSDSSSAGRDALALGDVQQVPGRHTLESAAKLGGTGYLDIPSLGQDLTGLAEVTVEAWVRTDAHGKNVFRTRQPVGLGSDRFQVSNYADGSGWATVLANPAPPLGRWYHLAGVFDHGELRIYVDGELSAALTVPWQVSDGTGYPSWGLGARVPGGSSAADQFFAGEIDDVKVYLEALSDAEIELASNRRPVARRDVATTAAGECLDIAPLANDRDPDGDPLGLAPSLVSPPSHGVVLPLDETHLKYCPDLGFTGTDSFTYEVRDGRGGADQAEVLVDVGILPYFDTDRQLRVIEEGAGWKRLMAHDKDTGESLNHELLVVWESGVATAPVSASQRVALQDDFAEGEPESGPGPGGLGEEVEDFILIDLTTLNQVEAQVAAGATGSGDQEDCFGWNDKEKTRSYDINEWARQGTFDLGDDVDGEYSINLPFEGQVTLVVRYRVQESVCLPTKFKFKDVRAYGNVSIEGGAELAASASLTGSWGDEDEIAAPLLGKISLVSIGPINIGIDITLPVDIGWSLEATLSGEIGLSPDFSAAGSFDYTCTRNGCDGTSELTDNFDSSQITGSLEAQIKAQAYAKVQVRAELVNDELLFAEAGVKPLIEADLWGYYGNTCGDADGDGNNETVSALLADLYAGYDIIYGWGGKLISDRERTLEGDRFHVAWWDLLGGSTVLTPMLDGPSTVERFAPAAYTVSMRPCYPYGDRVDFLVEPGTWNGEMSIAEPGSSDPARSSSVVDRVFPTAQSYLLRATALGDAEGRNFAGASTDRTLQVLELVTLPIITTQPESQAVIAGSGDAVFEVVASGSSLSYQWRKDGVPLSDGGAFSGTGTSTLTVAVDDPLVAGSYSVRVSNSGAAVTSADAVLTVLPPAPDLAIYQDWDDQEVALGSTFVFPDPAPEGVSISRRFRLVNEGSTNLELVQPSTLVSGTCFHQVETPSAILEPGEESWLRVRLLCAQGGTFGGLVTISSNDPDESPYYFGVEGTVIADDADIAVTQNWDGAAMPSGGVFTFPDPTPVGESISRAFLVTNEGSSDLVLSNGGQMVSGPCFHEIETPQATLAPGASDHLRVRLHCQQAGTFTGTVTLLSNDPDESPYTFTVIGTVSP